jgi:F-type H+-transporting ATPase subunit b
MAATPTPVTHASTAAPDASASGLPQFDIGQWPGQMVWILIIFVVMFVLFSRVFLPRVAGTIADREDRIAGDIGDARRMKEQADAEAAAAAAETAEARARALRLGLDARARAQAESAAEDAREQARLTETLAQADRRILSARNEAMTHVREIAMQAASAMVERLTGTVPTVGQLRAAQARGEAQ